MVLGEKDYACSYTQPIRRPSRAWRRLMFSNNAEIARRIYRSLKTPSTTTRGPTRSSRSTSRAATTTCMMRCNKSPEVSIKGKDQTAGEVKFFAYSDFSDFNEEDVLFKLKDEVRLIELYRNGAIEAKSFDSWGAFTAWLNELDETACKSHSSCRVSCTQPPACSNPRCRTSSSRRSSRRFAREASGPADLAAAGRTVPVGELPRRATRRRPCAPTGARSQGLRADRPPGSADRADSAHLPRDLRELRRARP